MATAAPTGPAGIRPIAADDRFFFYAAIAMSAVMFAGFSTSIVMGRSTFSSPPLVHAHALIFFGWITLYLAQNALVATGSMTLHRRLGWIGAVWPVPMIALGCAVTVAMARAGHVPFFFKPLHFLIFDPLTVIFFAGLTWAAVAMRRQTGWHRRLHFCGTALLLGPGFGRLLPMPLLQPWAFETTFACLMFFPAAGVIADLRRSGRVHPAWGWGIASMIAYVVAIEALTYSPLGAALYDRVAAGSPGAMVAPLQFGTPPAGSLITGR